MTPIHLLDLGSTVDAGKLKELLQSQGRTELVRGILQMLRDTAIDSACGAVDGLTPRNDHFIHASLGRYDGLANTLRELLDMCKLTPADGESEEESLLADQPVPTE